MRNTRQSLLVLFAFLTAPHLVAECSLSGTINGPAYVYRHSAGNVATAAPDQGVVVAQYTWAITFGTITSTSPDGSSITFSVDHPTGQGSGYVYLNLTMSDGAGCTRPARSIAVPIVVRPPGCETVAATLSAPAAANTRTLDVQASPSCDWTVSHLPNWISIMSGASGTGNGTVVLSFSRNAAAQGRSSEILVNDSEVFVYQQGVNSIYPDYNRDGITDLLWRQTGGQGIVFTSFMNGTATNGGRWITGEANSIWNAYPAPDYDNNGMSDLAWARAGTGSTTLYDLKYVQDGYGVVSKKAMGNAGMLAGHSESNSGQTYQAFADANGSVFLDEGSIPTMLWTQPAGWELQAIADFDGNLQTDFLYRHLSDGRISLVLNSKDVNVSPVSAVIHTEPDYQWQIVAAGDVNGDGRADVIWRNTTDGRIWTMLMNGFSWTGGAVVWTEPDSHWVLKGTGDFNGDGRADLLFRNDLNGIVFVVLLDGNNVLASGIAHYEPDLNWHLVGPTTTRLMRNRNSSLVP